MAQGFHTLRTQAFKMKFNRLLDMVLNFLFRFAGGTAPWNISENAE